MRAPATCTYADRARDMGQNDPIIDVEGREITAQSVNARLDDWLRRLHTLFRAIKDWAASTGWRAEDGATISMHEEIMQMVGVADREQPTLHVRNSEGAEIWIKPKGLWVIGANGRVDMYSRKGAFILVDIADAFQPPQWVLHRIGKGEGKSFDPGQLADMI